MTEPSDEFERETNSPPPLEEGRDYYFEGQLMVFTSSFLLKRGFCCENGCRHCPYGYSIKDKDEH